MPTRAFTPTTAVVDGAAPAQLPVTHVAEARARTLGFLSQVLGGDAVAAEYLLLQLVSRCAFAVAGRFSDGFALTAPQ